MNYPTLDTLPSPPLDKIGWPWTQSSESLPNSIPGGSYWPKVTIVTPSYNQGQFIEETIRSVLLQGYPNLEYIVIDGGSTDSSLEIIHKYETWITYWISEPDRGQSDAINKGFDQSSGDFLGWINSDDYLYPGAIAKMVVELHNNPEVSFVYGDIDEGSESEGGIFRRYGEQLTLTEMLKTYRVPIPQQGSMWRRTVIQQIGGLDSRWHFVLDREFFLRVTHNFQIAYVPGAVGFFRYHGDSKSISDSQTHYWLTEIPLMYHDFFERNDLSSDLLALKNQAMGAIYLNCASRAFSTGQKKLGFEFLKKAFQSDLNLIFRDYLYAKLSNNFLRKKRFLKIIKKILQSS